MNDHDNAKQDPSTTLGTELRDAFAVTRRLWSRTGVQKAIAVLIVVVVVLAAPDCSGNKDANAISAILERDHHFSLVAGQEVQSGATPVAAMAKVVQSMKALDLRDCPPDFREAYVRHTAAWEAMAVQLSQEPQSISQGLWMGLVNSLTRGEMDGGAGRLSTARDQRTEQIRTTWVDVSAIAARYGAKMPSN